jgi:hypothetical protein
VEVGREVGVAVGRGLKEAPPPVLTRLGVSQANRGRRSAEGRPCQTQAQGEQGQASHSQATKPPQGQRET